MSRRTHLRRQILLRAALSAVPVVWLEVLSLAMGTPFSLEALALRWAFSGALLLLVWWMAPYSTERQSLVRPRPCLIAAAVGVVASAVYAALGLTWAAWVLLGVLYLLLMVVGQILTERRAALWRWAIRGLLALAGGVVAAAIAQIGSHFSDEEFFVALEALALAIYCFLLLATNAWASRGEPARAEKGLRLDRRWLGLGLILLALAGLNITVRAYQQSFYPPQVPAFEGISTSTPFQCGEVPADTQIYDGLDLFQRLIARVEAHPDKQPPEYGMLALATGERHWAEAFRQSLLGEAAEGRFAQPANSVKWGQYQAAQRAYYTPRVQAAFPGLFSDDELDLVKNWFAEVNRRALTAEWVDVMYGLALGKWPEGPYENQENGAGLLALLEAEGLAAPERSADNRKYLDRSPRGWQARFRNTDDAYIYQPEWIFNAYYQSLYHGEVNKDHQRDSLEWLLLQALPDGARLRYNHPGAPTLAGIAYLGAQLLNDPRYIWLAGRALANLEAGGEPLRGHTGIEQPLPLVGRSPKQGSCLLYGDSGLPNQPGPLAPDKIVFRDGWSEGSAYLLLNLRFTGWHRYKATNTIPLLYRQGPLVIDKLEGQRFPWLPEGRSQFRDKRIPRENLSGLLVERSGMSAVLQTLTGIGSLWAQDPPFYAEVLAFETGDGLDWSHTRLTDWHGWQHDRRIYFYHNGPIIIFDQAEGPPGQQAALAWHLAGEPDIAGQRLQLGSGEGTTEFLLLSLADTTAPIEMSKTKPTSVLYRSPTGGRLGTVTLFLPGPWVGARVEVDATGRQLSIKQGEDLILLPVPPNE